MRTYFRISTTNGLLGVTKLIIIGLFFNVALASAATIVVPTSADSVANGAALQTALNNVQCGDEIVLQAGATFSGNFALPYKGACTGTSADYITIRTSNLGGIPSAGTRITAAHAGAMAKLMATSSIPALEAEANAHHFKLIGIEITNVGGNVVTQELVLLGARSSGGGIPFSQQPHHITFDRCWIHEATNDTTTPDSIVTTAIRGFNLNATDITITESRIAGFRAYQPVSQGVEASNAILFPSSALRVTVQNTFLEAWFCPVFFGGSGGGTPNTATLTNPAFDAIAHTGSAIFSSVSNLHAGDLVAMKTTNGRTPSTNYAHPNELVQFQVVEVTAINGNTVSFQSWGTYDGNLAGGNPLLQLPDSPGLAQWNGYLNQDITLSRNQFVENFVSTEKVWTSTGGSPTTQPRSTQVNTGNAPKGMIEIKMAKNLLISGNTFEGWEVGFTVTSRNQGNVQTSGGFPWAGVFNVTISNNWWKKMQNWDRIYGYPIGGPQLEDNEYSNVRSGPFTFSNNLIESGIGPILSAMGAADNVTVAHNTYPGPDVPMGDSMVIGQGANSPNFVFVDNILSNNEYGRNCQSSQPCWPGLVQNHNVILDNRSPNGKIGDGPLDSKYPSDYIAANQSAVGWVDPLHVNYTLANNSPYKNRASDGTDPGVDMNALIAALGGTGLTYVLSISKTGTGSGTVASNPSGISCGVTCSAALPPGQVITLTATPASGSFLVGWSGDADCADGTVTMSAARSCVVRYDLPQANLTRLRGDFSGDGKSDIVWQNADGSTTLWLMDGLNRSSGGGLLGPGTGWSVKQRGDFNGDFKTDIVWQHTNGSTTLWLMDGLNMISGGVLIGAGTGWSVKQIGDFNGDGKSDIVWQQTDGRTAIWLMDGLNMISGGGLIGAGTGWSVKQIGDFNGDGKSDIVWQHTDGRTAIWLMDGLNMISGGGLIGAGTGWSVKQIGDFNGDGKSDIVWENTDGSTAMWLMNGLNVIGGGGLIAAGTGWSVKQIGDFNGDGKSDIVWQHTDGSSSIWLMDGLIVSSGRGLRGAGSGWSVNRIGDFNGDGKSDIIWQHTDGSSEIWLMNGLNISSVGGLLGPATNWSPAP